MLPAKTYYALVAQVLDKGRATMRITVNPMNFPSVRNFFVNAKSRDQLNKAQLSRYVFTEDYQAKNITIQLELKPSYLIAMDASSFEESFSEGQVLTEELLDPEDT